MRTEVGPFRLLARIGFVVVAGLLVVMVFAGEGLPTRAERARSLADATEASVPERYKAMPNPIAPTESLAAVAKGRRLAEQYCVSCHAADFKGKPLGGFRASDLTASAVMRTEEYLMWAVSEGSAQGMPKWKAQFSEEQRWQLVTFIKSLEQ